MKPAHRSRIARTAVFASALALVLAGPGCTAQTAADPSASSECLTPGHWYTLQDGARRVAARAQLEAAARQDVVLLGETHDRAEHHRWQLHTLAALHALRPQMVIGFEAFPRSAQPVLERWVRGELAEQAFLEAVDWQRIWGFDPELYLPLFHFARLHRVPMRALNVERELVRTVGKSGWAAVPRDRREGLGEPAPASAGYRRFLRQIFGEHARERAPAPGAPSDAAFERFVESQLVWDRAMAEALARPLMEAAGDRPLVIGIVGSGHLRFGYGVPHQLRALGIERIETLLPVETTEACGSGLARIADAIFVLPAGAKAAAPRPRLGVMLAQDGTTVRIERVLSGSLAQTSGLLAEDRITHVAGRATTGVAQLIDAVRSQPPGTWLPLRVARGAAELEIVIRFPPEP